ncbi:MAG: mechanosensitive ion channel [Deltaproteobacteria bacterium]|jgi:small-conductance mechanosensitive channel|nr:mechanosensitive ion channel [Deltaproteobacteria bacterium]
MRKLFYPRRTASILRLFFICLIILFTKFSLVPAQEPTGLYQGSEFLTSATAPVIVDGKELFRVSGVTSYPAKDRARKIATRIKNLAEDRTFDPNKLEIIKEGEVTYIKAGSRNALGLVENDAVREGISLELLAKVTQEKIKLAIIEYRNDRAPRVLLINSGYALIATVLAILLLWGILRVFIWLDALAQRRIMGRVERLQSKSHYIIDAEQVGDILRGLHKIFKVLTILVVIYFYLNLVLGLYPWTRLFAKYLFALTIDPLRIIGLGIVDALPNIFFLAILFFITRYILKLTRLFFTGIDRGSIQLKNFEREWGMPTYRIARLLIVSFAVIVAYPYIPGSSSDAFKGVSIFLGVIFSLGSSSVLTNIIAGYTITYRRAFKIGDRIMINDLMGEVVNRSVLVTRLRSLKNEEIVIPNSNVLNSNIINYTTEAQANGLILHTTVGIGYEVPWRQVEAMLLLAADRTKGLRAEPKPFVLQQSLGDFAVNYELNVYCDDVRHMMQLYSHLHRNILDVFNEYNVQIMTPNYEHDTEQPKLVPPDQWYAPPAKKSPQDTGKK